MDDAEYVDIVSGNRYLNILILNFVNLHIQPEFAGESDGGKLHEYLEGAECEVIITDELHPG